jgi:hypothetical protein
MTSHNPASPCLAIASHLVVLKDLSGFIRKTRQKELVRPVPDDVDSIARAPNDASTPMWRRPVKNNNQGLPARDEYSLRRTR